MLFQDDKNLINAYNKILFKEEIDELDNKKSSFDKLEQEEMPEEQEDRAKKIYQNGLDVMFELYKKYDMDIKDLTRLAESLREVMSAYYGKGMKFGKEIWKKY